MKSVVVLIIWLLWLIATVFLTITVIGLMITLQDEWMDIGSNTLEKL